MPWGEILHFMSISVLSAIVSWLFVSRVHLQICGRQDIASALVAEGNRSATNSPDLITIILSSLSLNIPRGGGVL